MPSDVIIFGNLVRHPPDPPSEHDITNKYHGHLRRGAKKEGQGSSTQRSPNGGSGGGCVDRLSPHSTLLGNRRWSGVVSMIILAHIDRD